MQKIVLLFAALLLLTGASSRPPSQSGPIVTAPPRAGPIVNGGGTRPTGTSPIGKANNGTNKPQSGGRCTAPFQRCNQLCGKLYPPGVNVIDGKSALSRCLDRCWGKYAHCL